MPNRFHRCPQIPFLQKRKVREKAAKFKKRNPKTTVNGAYLIHESAVGEDAVVHNIDEEYDRLVQYFHLSAAKSESSEITKRHLFPKTLNMIRYDEIARATGNRELTSELAKQCRQAIKQDLEEQQ
uniref:Nucleolar protein 16 n=1 Tax=Angiostrongylus cantonensis TaxID=6313 RepID=A0A0K0D5V3_ANGCA